MLAGALPPAFVRALATLDVAKLQRDAGPAGWRGCQRWFAKHGAPDPRTLGAYDYHAVSFGWLVGGALERLAAAGDGDDGDSGDDDPPDEAGGEKEGRDRRVPFDALLRRRLTRPLGIEAHVAAKLPRSPALRDRHRHFDRLAQVCVPDGVAAEAMGALGDEPGFVPDPRLINEPACASVLLPSTTMHASAP